MKKSYLPLVLALSASMSGCFFGNQAKVKVPSPPLSGAPATTQPPPVSSTPAPSEGAETAPENPPAPASPSEPSSIPAPAPVPVPAPRPPVARINPPAATAAPPSGPAMPQLAEILTPEQRRQYQAEYAQDVARSDAALKRASGHNLSAAQREAVTRIRTFLSQAQAARYNDIATAVQLSRRADLLGQELLKGLK